jgi:ABC-type dipeptide/oligopeptide/nickel transport system permease subunit
MDLYLMKRLLLMIFLFIGITVLGYNLPGEGIRDSIDPRLK